MARIMVVADDPYLRDSILETLSYGEHQVYQSDTAHAPKLCVRHKPNIVVVDLATPGTGDNNLIRALRATGINTRIIALSRFKVTSATPYLSERRLFEADAIIAKPFKLQEIIQLIDGKDVETPTLPAASNI